MATAEEDQERFLEEALNVVKQQAFYMKREMDADSLEGALKHASNMLRELRTGLLSPKNYYELWMAVFDEMRYLQTFFSDLNRKGTPMVELYQRVQYAGNVVPRLYLLMTVGAVYIESREAPAKDILKDLVEMAKGVQHPMRGLFVRNYLSQISKNKLPDTGSEYEGEGGGVEDAVEFVQQNFGEMNRLWVRMQHEGKKKGRKKREKERQQLRILVGTNLVRLSQLDGVDLEMYKATVLPVLLEQVSNCKDKIAQHYLMDCIIQVFPDEYHLQTLELFLTTCTGLQAGVDVKSILINLMERIANYAAENGGQSAIPEEINAFQVVNEHVAKVVQQQASMDVTDILALQVALLEFAIKCYPDKLEYIDHILGFSADLLSRLVGEAEEKVDSASAKYVVQLLSIPLEVASLEVLSMSHYPTLMNFLRWDSRKDVAAKLLQSFLGGSIVLENYEVVDKLLRFISPLVKDDPDTPGEEEMDASEFSEHQLLVASLMSRMRHDDTDELFKILTIARKHFGKGGVRRIRYTLPPLCFGYMALVRRVAERQKAGETVQANARKVFQYIHEITTALAGVVDYQDTALRLFLQGAVAADSVGAETVAYEFMTQAFTLYEETADSKAQLRVIGLMCGTLQRMTVFSKDNFETLITKTTQYSARLLKKPDQCRMVYTCAHLFWSKTPVRELREGEEEPAPGQNGKRALECLQRALKIADACVASSTHVVLFIEILNRYLHFFEAGLAKVTPQYITGLLALINEHLGQMEDVDERAKLEAFFNGTKKYIVNKRESDEPGRYAEIEGV